MKTPKPDPVSWAILGDRFKRFSLLDSDGQALGDGVSYRLA